VNVEDDDLKTAEHRETLLWKACSEQVRMQLERFTSLDSKAGILIGFIAAALGEILGALILVTAEHSTWFGHLTISVATVTFVTGMASIALAASFSVLILWPRPFVGVDFGVILQDMKDATTEDRNGEEEVMKFQARYAAEKNLLSVWRTNEESIVKKLRWVRPLALFIGIGVICLSISAIAILVEGAQGAVGGVLPRGGGHVAADSR